MNLTDAIKDYTTKNGNYPTKIYVKSDFLVKEFNEWYKQNTTPFYSAIPYYVCDKPNFMNNNDFILE